MYSRQFIVTLALVSYAKAPICAQTARYRLETTITTDSNELGFLALDPVGRRLYGAGDHVVDLDSWQSVGTIVNPEHGIVVAPELARGIGTDGILYDLRTLQVIDSVLADGYTSAYDRATGRAFLFRRRTTVVDLRTARVVGFVDLGSDPESGISDNSGHVFVNLPDVSAVAVIDAHTLRVTRRPLPGCHVPLGSAIDAQARRLFVACDSALHVYDTDDGKHIAAIRGIRGGRQIGFDPGSKLLFNPNGIKGGATISVIREIDPDHYQLVQNLPTGPDGGRQIVVDPQTHRLFLATARWRELIAIYVFAPVSGQLVPAPVSRQ